MNQAASGRQRDRAMIRQGTFRGIDLCLAFVFFFMTWLSINYVRRDAAEAARIADGGVPRENSGTDSAGLNEKFMTPPVRVAVFGGACLMALVGVWFHGRIPQMIDRGGD